MAAQMADLREKIRENAAEGNVEMVQYYERSAASLGKRQTKWQVWCDALREVMGSDSGDEHTS
jgi:hypothetical protein